MEAKELRLGNYITDNENRLLEVFNINRSTLRAYAIDNDLEDIYSHYEEVLPIPLTEEWLLRFRFKKHKLDDSWWYTKSCGKNKPELITNDIGEGAYSTKLKFVFIDEYDNIEIKYVHRLQNLYFALTGKELEAKEPELIK